MEYSTVYVGMDVKYSPQNGHLNLTRSRFVDIQDSLDPAKWTAKMIRIPQYGQGT